MIRIACILMFMTLIGALHVHAQCDLVINYFIVNVGCEEPDLFPMGLAGVSGGTPPYSYEFVTNEGYSTMGQSQNPDWQRLITNGISSEYSATLIVTDAEGCAATADYSWTPHWPITAVLEVSETCDDSIRFEWNGQFEYQYTAIPVDFPCGGPHIFGIGSGTGNYVSGTVEEDWTEVAPGHWRYQLPLSFGAAYVGISNSAGFCDISTQIQCYKVVYLYELPVTPATDCVAQFSMRSMLGGALTDGALMTDALRTSNLLPTTEPYSALGYNYVGTAPGLSVQPALFSITGSNAVVDWVVEVYAASDPTLVVHSQPALVQRDGDVMDVNGALILTTPLPSGEYHLALHHRNHLDVMTGASFTLSSSPALINFTSPATPTYGTNAQRNINGTMALWPGDVNGNGVVRYTGTNNDRDPILTAVGGSVPTNVLTSVYNTRDVNLDGNVRYTGTANDRDFILTTVGGTVPTAVRVAQLP